MYLNLVEMDASSLRLPLTLALAATVAAFLYAYLLELFIILTVCLSTPLLYRSIQRLTAQTHDPAGKFVFITGCDSGFGLAIARSLRDLDFKVVAGCFSLDSDGARRLAVEGKVEVLQLDVTDDKSVLEAAEKIKVICCGKGLWGVVNNAGISVVGCVELVPLHAFRTISEVNLFGAIRVTKVLLPLVRQARGRVVNMTSACALNSPPYMCAYSVAKSGLETFSSCLRADMARFEVKVITVSPGNFAGATNLISSQVNLNRCHNTLLEGWSALSEEDRKVYPREGVDQWHAILKNAGPNSCCCTAPVVDAFIDALVNAQPHRKYLVHGGSGSLDPIVVAAKLRMFLPEVVMEHLENIIFKLL